MPYTFLKKVSTTPRLIVHNLENGSNVHRVNTYLVIISVPVGRSAVRPPFLAQTGSSPQFQNSAGSFRDVALP